MFAFPFPDEHFPKALEITLWSTDSLHFEIIQTKNNPSARAWTFFVRGSYLALRKTPGHRVALFDPTRLSRLCPRTWIIFCLNSLSLDPHYRLETTAKLRLVREQQESAPTPHIRPKTVEGAQAPSTVTLRTIRSLCVRPTRIRRAIPPTRASCTASRRSTRHRSTPRSARCRDSRPTRRAFPTFPRPCSRSY